MQAAVTMHMAQKYRISDKNGNEVFDFLKQNFGCNRKVYNLCVDSLYAQLEKAEVYHKMRPYHLYKTGCQEK